MSEYSTGEIAKLCGVTVRTVQYYDGRGILVPTSLSEGGRRLYSDSDLRRLKIICFLREVGLSLDSISELMSEEQPENVISLLLEQQETVLRDEISEKKEKLDKLTELKKGLSKIEKPDSQAIGDMALIMENKKKLKRVYTNMLLVGIPLVAMELASIIIWIVTGIWWPFIAYLLVDIPFAILVSRYYLNSVAYICPQCHKVFKPTFKEAFWARHTLHARKLTCTECGHHGFCVETYGKEETVNASD